MDLNPSKVDEPTVRRFVELIHTRAAHAINGGDTGVLQLVRIHPADESISVSRYDIGDVKHMTQDAVAFSAAGHNVYIEGRTVRADLRGNKRGDFKDTAWVFALVIDSDNDKGRAWIPTTQASIVVETSPGNAHYEPPDEGGRHGGRPEGAQAQQAMNRGCDRDFTSFRKTYFLRDPHLPCKIRGPFATPQPS